MFVRSLTHYTIQYNVKRDAEDAVEATIADRGGDRAPHTQSTHPLHIM
jgi:hypothetical protein